MAMKHNPNPDIWYRHYARVTDAITSCYAPVKSPSCRSAIACRYVVLPSLRAFYHTALQQLHCMLNWKETAVKCSAHLLWRDAVNNSDQATIRSADMFAFGHYQSLPMLMHLHGGQTRVCLLCNQFFEHGTTWVTVGPSVFMPLYLYGTVFDLGPLSLPSS